jgi:hypothetical protein
MISLVGSTNGLGPGAARLGGVDLIRFINLRRQKNEFWYHKRWPNGYFSYGGGYRLDFA